MTEPGDRTGPARDVPPPRPVPAPPPVATDEGGGLGRAARVVAEAAARLLGSPPPGERSAGPRSGTGARAPSAAGVVRDVVAAIAGAVAGRRDGAAGNRAGATASPGAGAGFDRTPTAILGELLTAAAPQLGIRDADRLRRAHPGATDEEIADALIARAARVTTGIGAAAGGLSAAQWLAPPSLLVLPLQLGAETVLVAAVEVVLVGELHELYGRPAPGDAADRAAAYLASWSRQRAVDGSAGGVAAVLGAAGMRALRHRLGRRLARNLSSAAPLLLGAALAGRGNRRATEALGRRLRADLRRARDAGDGTASGTAR